ncbi:MAG: hypothetical protein ACFFGZ_14385 [Candidatus Thorarchaeota archaeon]
MCQYFNNCNIPYCIIGGVAVLFQGRFRTTEDIDFVIFHENLSIPGFTNFCKINGLSVGSYDLQEGVKDGSQITIMDFPNSIRVDLKIATSRWEKGVVKEAEAFKYDNITIMVAKPEFLISNKLYKGGRVDLEDAYSVYYQNEERISLELLKELVQILGVEEALDKFLAKKPE